MNSSIHRLFLASVLFALPPAVAGAEPKSASTPVEHLSQPPHHQPVLGTMAYAPSAEERPFFDKLDTAERATGGSQADYDITAKAGRYVGWFGVVRVIAEDAAAQQTTLTVEHKYFDGMTDAHIMALSFNGSGDFRAVLRGIGLRIPRLSLVKVYGTVAAGKKDAPPRIDPVFVRNWHWGTFTFLAAWGKQRGSEAWRKLNEVKLDDIYDPYPDTAYYQERLGKRTDDAARKKAIERLALTAGYQPTARPKPQRIPAAEFRARAMQAAAAAHARSEATVAPLVDATLADVSLEEAIEKALAAKVDRAAAVAVLGEALKHENPDVRIAAIERLRDQMSYSARLILPAVVAALRDENEYVPYQAAETLGNIGPAAQAAVPDLIAAMVSEDSHTRAYACEALGKIRGQPKLVVPALLLALDDDDHFVRWQAAGALGHWGLAAAAAAPRLAEALASDDDGDVRWQAADALAAVDPDGRIAIPALDQALKGESHAVRLFAAGALVKLAARTRAVAPVLRPLVTDRDASVAIEAAEGLWKAEQDVAVVPLLIDAIKHGETNHQRKAAAALAAIGPAAKDVLPLLGKLLADKKHDCLAEFVQLAGALGPAAESTVPLLVPLLDDQRERVPSCAAAALWKINRHPRAIPTLVAELGRPGGHNYYASEEVAAIGPPAAAAVPGLVRLLSHETWYVRDSAAAAIKKIDPAALPSSAAEEAGK